MAQGRGSSRAGGQGRGRARKASPPKSMGQLEKAIDAAEKALKDLRKDLGRSGSSALKEINQTIKDSRKHARSLSKTVARDLEKLQSAAARATPSRSSSRSTSSRSASGRSSSGRSATGRSTSSRSASASSRSKSTGRSSSARSGSGRAGTARKSAAAKSRTTRKKS